MNARSDWNTWNVWNAWMPGRSGMRGMFEMSGIIVLQVMNGPETNVLP